ncbi:MarR family winged helix-turn-helix transcriptional regulator [Nonomuraea jiangxiensis]|uniref:Winged helix DNA-binding domain-containing protein n=1 Tax=Nonomuraea jiangxiensis TaxID=633440 RepID=A0A1G9HG97_9ACTN|nr:winged helix DNA-binding protein [Nonomuraea jiangxiensis]SDL12010.1 Winged helix DNA-binding domain-containing protein [Nonomuraea jiangxiensis]
MTGLGTLLRHVHELMDGAISDHYADLGLPEYRPRFSPVVRTLVSQGPMAIRDLATAIGVTHSAASQTVVEMRRCDLVTLEKGADARQRIVHLTPKAQATLPEIEAEWAATERAVRELDAELPVPLAEVLRATVEALERRPFRDRIEAARAG